MSDSSAVGRRSEPIVLATPRGSIEIVRQQRRSRSPRARWEWEWLARRKGQAGWRQAPRAVEAIRQAALVSAGKHPAWLLAAAAEAERELGRAAADDDQIDTAPDPSIS